jgi:endonuclease/exonuclease/phosphatase (EEP) superfamily protein YafD
LRIDALAAITLAPSWAWLAPGLLSAVLQRWLAMSRLVWASAALWIAFPLVFCDSPRSLARWGNETPREKPGGALRVVTLNCGGDIRAAREAAAWQPDVLLLQESPGEEQLAALRDDLFGAEGALVRAPDCSIIARGRVMEAPRRRARHFTHAVIRLSTGEEVMIVSLRLRPVPWRLDAWSSDFWRTYADHRGRHRSELRRVMRAVNESKKTPLIVGGDFNAPAGDAVFRELPTELRDAFREAGAGWGNTILNEWPVHRIDQIWSGRGLRASHARAMKTKHSDHRLVVADLVR